VNKKDFIINYICNQPQKIRAHFNYDLFLKDANILISSKKIKLKEFEKFYTPWHQKNGKICGTIETVETDPEYRTIKILEVVNYPEKKPTGKLPTVFEPIPLLTDKSTKKTLVLDSNHLLGEAIQKLPKNKLFDVFEIVSENAELLVKDFKIINRDVV
jgi:hypothetical protein